MQRIHFTAADFARTRLRTTAGPLTETAFAHGMLTRGVGTPFARWRRQVAPQLSGHRDGMLLPHVWRAAVAPYWPRIVTYLESECDVRGRVLVAGGVDLLLGTLHPRIRWCSPVLEIPGGPDEDIHLAGRGLVLTPSVFLHHRPAQLTENRQGDGEATLVFAAPPDAQRAAELWDEPADGPQSLEALVGPTRAAALRALRTTCTTSQLADRLGISAAGASQHTAVLRRTGLITTRRIRNTVLHTLTSLGVALLEGLAVSPQRRHCEAVPQQIAPSPF
ncbi:ArsR/SmtB family transcription factor [Streptomyces sp. NPDC053069]|uniref:ArsR/SmtB family transcription factor n=1 Tax=Streptomyces sp. NPDC053069 TaxID=3365695 RepID=UPI0037CD1C49